MITAAELAGLSVPDKIRIVTELWDQIAAQQKPVQLPSSVLDEADHRLEKLEQDPSQGMTEDQVWQKVDAAR